MSARLLEALRERVRRAGASTVDFFALVRRLEELLETRAGEVTDARLERIHFTHPPRFAFPAGDVTDLAIAAEGSNAEATVATSFLGLLGTESPLGAPWSEDVLFEDEPDGTLAFYDVFQHRAVALAYRAWARFSPFAVPSEDGFAAALLSLVGVDAFAEGHDARAVDPEQALGLSDLLRCDPSYLDVDALESILTRFYPALRPRVSVTAPVWVPKSHEDATLLGVQQCVLGRSFNYGTGALDLAGTLRITVGPVDRSTCAILMPGGHLYRALRDALAEWLADRVTIELEVVVRGRDAPRLRLGDSHGARLGIDVRYASDEEFVRTRVLLLADETHAVRTYHAG